MPINVLVRRLLWGATTFCVLAAALSAKSAQAQVFLLDDESDQLSVSTGLIESGPSELLQDSYRLSLISDRMNTTAAHAQSQRSEVPGLALAELPLIGDMLDDSGNLDLGIELPFSVNVTDVMGTYGMVLSADVSVTQVERAWDSVSPLDR